MTDCCENGIVHTELMKKEFEELQNPPAEFLALIQEPDQRKRNQFLQNLKALNNMYGFASIHGEKAPPELIGGRNDTCKYNGIVLDTTHDTSNYSFRPILFPLF